MIFPKFMAAIFGAVCIYKLYVLSMVDAPPKRRRAVTKGNLNNAEVSTHPLSNDPTQAWVQLSRISDEVAINDLQLKNIPENRKLRVVCWSDTHALISKANFEIPHGDVFIHAGDFTDDGKKEHVEEFNEWLGNLRHDYKIVIAGNQEFNFDEHRDLLKNAVYLQDDSIVIHGIKFYGTPWVPKYKPTPTAFSVERGIGCAERWSKIPDDVDVLISHSPPVGHGDLCSTMLRAGCVDLLTTVEERLKNLKFHIFGHIHDGYGVTTNGKVYFVNAAMLDINKTPVNAPIVFDIELPKPKMKRQAKGSKNYLFKSQKKLRKGSSSMKGSSSNR